MDKKYVEFKKALLNGRAVSALSGKQLEKAVAEVSAARRANSDPAKEGFFKTLAMDLRDRAVCIARRKLEEEERRYEAIYGEL